MNLQEWTITISVSAEEALAALDSVAERIRALASQEQPDAIRKTFDTKPVSEFDSAVARVLDTVDAATDETADGMGKIVKAQEEAESAFKSVLKGTGGFVKDLFSRKYIEAGIDLISTIPDIIQWISSAQEKAREEERRREAERKQAVYDEASVEKSRYDRLVELESQYTGLAKKEKPTIDDAAQLSRVRRELADSYGIEAAAVAFTKGEYDSLRQAIDAQKQVELSDLFFAQNDATWERLNEAKDASKGYFQMLKEINSAKEAFSEKELNSTYDKNKINQLQVIAMIDPRLTDLWDKSRKELEKTGKAFTLSDIFDKMLEGEQQKLLGSIDVFSAWLAQHFSQHITALNWGRFVVPDDLASSMLDTLISSFDPTRFESWESLESTMRAAMEAMADTFRDEDMMDSIGVLQRQMADASLGMQPDQDAINGAWTAVLGHESPLMKAMLELPEFAGAGTEAVRSLLTACLGLEGMGDGPEATAEYLRNTADAFLESSEQAKDVFASLGEDGQTLGAQFDSYTGDLKGYVEQVDKLGSQRAALNNLKKLSAELKSCDKGSKKYDDTLSAINQELKKTSISTEGLGDNMENLDGAIAKSEAETMQSAQGISASLQNIIDWAKQTKANMLLEGHVDMDTDPAIAALNRLISVAMFVQSLLGAFGVGGSAETSIPRGGGGGGGRRNEAEEAARAAEEARKEAIQRDYDMIDHKRHMNEITLEEELELLEAIRRNHQLNAEEIMEWEEKVYDLKKELRERDAESVDSLGDAVMDALEARYEAMRDAEIERLDASREAWEQWRDDSVKAIEDQIDALDKLSETEDREKKDQEELRKIAKLRQEVAFEQDDYNRLKLQQQLDKAVADRDERLRKLALEDQKDALREQIEQIERKADSEIDALDKEQDEIEAAYDERMKEAALRAEAEKLLMTQTQQQLLSLLKEFAPDYDATGQTLGEKLLEGFRSRVGDIAKWFEAFNRQMQAAQEQMASTAQAAANAFYQEHSQRAEGQAASMPPVVNQTVNFYEPVETPSQVARRMEDVNDALGELLG